MGVAKVRLTSNVTHSHAPYMQRANEDRYIAREDILLSKAVTDATFPLLSSKHILSFSGSDSLQSLLLYHLLPHF